MSWICRRAWVPAAEESSALQSRQTNRIEAENRHVLGVLTQTGGDKREAARILGVSRATLWRLLKRARSESLR